jgi:hypothetical protein
VSAIHIKRFLEEDSQGIKEWLTERIGSSLNTVFGLLNEESSYSKQRMVYRADRVFCDGADSYRDVTKRHNYKTERFKQYITQWYVTKYYDTKCYSVRKRYTAQTLHYLTVQLQNVRCRTVHYHNGTVS